MVFPLQGITAWPSPLKIQAFFMAFVTEHVSISFIFLSFIFVLDITSEKFDWNVLQGTISQCRGMCVGSWAWAYSALCPSPQWLHLCSSRRKHLNPKKLQFENWIFGSWESSFLVWPRLGCLNLVWFSDNKPVILSIYLSICLCLLGEELYFKGFIFCHHRIK